MQRISTIVLTKNEANNIEHCLKSVMDVSDLVALQMAEEGRKPSVLSALSHCLSKFLKMHLLKLGFLGGRRGFVVSVLGSYCVFIKYVRHWEKMRVTATAR